MLNDPFFFFFFCFQEREIRGFLFLEKQFFLPGLVGNAHYVDTVYTLLFLWLHKNHVFDFVVLVKLQLLTTLIWFSFTM